MDWLKTGVDPKKSLDLVRCFTDKIHCHLYFVFREARGRGGEGGGVVGRGGPGEEGRGGEAGK